VMGVAKSMGIAGADAVVGAAQKFSKWAGYNLSGLRAAHWVGTKAAPTVAKAGLKWFDRNVLGPKYSPRSIIAGWKAGTEKAEKEHLAIGGGAWHDKFNKVFGKGKTNYKMLAEQQVVANRQKEISQISEESEVLLEQIGNLLGNKSKTAQVDLQAIFKTLIKNNDHDEIMDWIRNSIQSGNAAGKQLAAMGFNDKNWDVTAGNTANAIETILNKSGVDDDHIDQHLVDLGNIASGNGGIMYGAASIGKDGKRHRNYTKNSDGSIDDSVMADHAARKIMTMPDVQAVPKSMHRNYFTDQSHSVPIIDLQTGEQKLDASGNPMFGPRLNNHGKALLRHYASPTAIEQVNRHKSDFYRRVGADRAVTQQMYGYAKTLQATDKDQAIQAAAYTAALQRRSGVDAAEIRAQLEGAGFTAEAEDVIKKSFGPPKEK